MRKTDPPKTYLSSRRWTEAEAQHALTDLERSGLEVGAFAVREGLDVQRLTRWQRRFASSSSPTFEEIAPHAIEAAIRAASMTPMEHERFEIVLRSGRVVRVPASFDADALRRLVEIAEEVRAC